MQTSMESSARTRRWALELLRPLLAVRVTGLNDHGVIAGGAYVPDANSP